MLAKTDTPNAPWVLVEANDMRWARIKVFDALVKAIEAVLSRRKALPAGVSRTAAAAAATRQQRTKKAAHDAQLAHAEEKKTVGAERTRLKAEAAHA